MENIEESLSNEIFVVAGATGRCGRYIVRNLLSKEKRVRVTVRSFKKLEETFSKEEVAKLDKIVVCNLVHDKDYSEKLEGLFQVNFNESVSTVISAMSYRFEKDQTSEQGNLLTNRRLIDAAVKHGKVKKFCLLSSSHVRRPFSYISLTCNINKKYMQHYKVQVEDYLRKSNLDYLIIRPVGLIMTEEASAYTIAQGDRVEGVINIATVGRLTVDAVMDPWIPSNTSFECISYKDQLKQPYEYIQGTHHLKAETEEEKRAVNHLIPARLARSGMFGLMFMFAYVAFRFGRIFLPIKRIASILRRMIGRGSQ